MTNIDVEDCSYELPLDLTLANNIHAAVADLSQENTFVLYDLNLSQSEKDILSNISFKDNRLSEFQYNSSLPSEKFSYNLQNYFDYKLVNSSYAYPLANILEKLYIASVYDNKPEEITVFTCGGNNGRVNDWHTDGTHDIIYRSFITLLGPATSFYNDNNVRDQINSFEDKRTVFNDKIDSDLIDYSRVIIPSIGQGVINNADTLHAAPLYEGEDRLFIRIDKHDMHLNTVGYIEGSMEDPNFFFPERWDSFWKIEI